MFEVAGGILFTPILFLILCAIFALSLWILVAPVALFFITRNLIKSGGKSWKVE